MSECDFHSFCSVNNNMSSMLSVKMIIDYIFWKKYMKLFPIKMFKFDRCFSFYTFPHILSKCQNPTFIFWYTAQFTERSASENYPKCTKSPVPKDIFYKNMYIMPRYIIP